MCILECQNVTSKVINQIICYFQGPMGIVQTERQFIYFFIYIVLTICRLCRNHGNSPPREHFTYIYIRVSICHCEVSHEHLNINTWYKCFILSQLILSDNFDRSFMSKYKSQKVSYISRIKWFATVRELQEAPISEISIILNILLWFQMYVVRFQT